MKKKLLILLIILGLIAMSSGCQKEIQEEYPEAMELMEKSAEYYNNVDNFEMKQLMNMTMMMPDMITGETKPVNMHVDSTSIVFVNPLKAKTTMVMEYDFEGDDEESKSETNMFPESITIEQYMVTDEDKFILYQYNMGQWFKIVLDSPELAMQQMQGLDYLKEYSKFFKNGEIVGIETVNGVEAYKAQFQLNSDYMVDLLNQYGLNETLLPDDKSEELMNKIFTALEDVVYEVWFSKEDYTMIKLAADVTPMFEGIKNVMMEEESLTEEEKNEINTIFGSMTGLTEIYYVNVNNCEDFEIPQEALDAQEMPYGI